MMQIACCPSFHFQPSQNSQLIQKATTAFSYNKNKLPAKNSQTICGICFSSPSEKLPRPKFCYNIKNVFFCNSIFYWFPGVFSAFHDQRCSRPPGPTLPWVIFKVRLSYFCPGGLRAQHMTFDIFANFLTTFTTSIWSWPPGTTLVPGKSFFLFSSSIYCFTPTSRVPKTLFFGIPPNF